MQRRAWVGPKFGLGLELPWSPTEQQQQQQQHQQHYASLSLNLKVSCGFSKNLLKLLEGEVDGEIC
ncbi:unnamed protein product [Prunus armeniaca]|uniref:Uncharacterized protein n=1 Tax=Prunus armeniaca TaxID=36596 RepID=A0A6J5XHH2_PRUAR|nr:unnamed protein product [Prunus armeniaca]